MSGHVASGELGLVASDGGHVAEAMIFGAEQGSAQLEQRLLEVAAGKRGERDAGDAEELLFVLSGTGALHHPLGSFPLARETAGLLLPHERFELEADAGSAMRVLSVRALDWMTDVEVGKRAVTLALADQQQQVATAGRTFKLLMRPEVGCRTVTQFVGTAPPSRARDHYHLYDEVIYVLDGAGILHLDDRATPFGPGSCIHLAPEQVHCVENTGTTDLRLLGVFRPALSPAEAYYPDGTPAEVG